MEPVVLILFPVIMFLCAALLLWFVAWQSPKSKYLDGMKKSISVATTLLIATIVQSFWHYSAMKNAFDNLDQGATVTSLIKCMGVPKRISKSRNAEEIWVYQNYLHEYQITISASIISSKTASDSFMD